MDTLRIKLAAVAAILAAAAAFGAQPASKAETTTAAQTQAFLAFYDQFVGIIEANQNDCAAMATRLDALLKANQQMLADGRAATAQGRQLPAAAQQHIVDDSRRMQAGVQKCAANPAVVSALQQLQR
jgi:hypothetical protein